MSNSRFIPSIPAKSEDDFDVSAASKLAGYRRYYGVLKVVRRTDGRLLFPFDGAPELGPFETRIEAIAAAQVYGEQLVAGDLAHPEM
ncbi:DUF6723 family protein [Paraburkholderia sp.]|uniref:DUF6723 family protein n=1 Tax=Paraburkholderia sp. TaxID=1926495 RepID=UPI00238E4017|nr:DUF6723 family protein [Paraburkholderia sp.]MDE1180370.1 hypothetical protein [Paraburkholderia sp.]